MKAEKVKVWFPASGLVNYKHRGEPWAVTVGNRARKFMLRRSFAKAVLVAYPDQRWEILDAGEIVTRGQGPAEVSLD